MIAVDTPNTHYMAAFPNHVFNIGIRDCTERGYKISPSSSRFESILTTTFKISSRTKRKDKFTISDTKDEYVPQRYFRHFEIDRR